MNKKMEEEVLEVPNHNHNLNQDLSNQDHKQFINLSQLLILM